MKALIPVFLGLTAAASAAAQQRPVQLHVKSAADEKVMFRIETVGSGVQLSGAAAITQRHESGRRIVEITAPAVLDVVGEGDLEIRLIASDNARLELTAPESTLPGARSVAVRGGRITLRRAAGSRHLGLREADEVIVRDPAK
jgi:hypothetical protein